jgi:hypothetical protein
MLERYFTARMTLRRLRFGPSGPYIDGFAAVLERDGYAKAIAKRYLRAAVHLGYFLQQQGGALTDIDSTTPEIFSRHLATCCCPLSTGEGNNHHPYFGAKRYCDYLVQIGVSFHHTCAKDPSDRRTGSSLCSKQNRNGEQKEVDSGLAADDTAANSPLRNLPIRQLL